jgi:putative SOS response-associated peptidase YedK
MNATDTHYDSALPWLFPPLLDPPFPRPLITMFALSEILISFRECAAATVEPHLKKSSRGSHPIPKQTDLPISYNIAPSQKVLAIRFNPKSQQRSLDAVQWGLIP